MELSLVNDAYFQLKKAKKENVVNVQEAKQFLENIINATGDPIFVKDEYYRFVVANDALCKMLGMDREKIIGKTLGEDLPKDQMDHFLSVDKKVLETGREDLSEEPLTGKEGKILTIVTKKTRFVDDKGNKFVVGVIRDITDRKKMEEQLQKKNEVAERMNKLIVGRELKMVQLKKDIASEKMKNVKDKETIDE
jgi:PAS domain S-box-containing protein